MLCVFYFTTCAIFVLYNVFSIQIKVQAATVYFNSGLELNDTGLKLRRNILLVLFKRILTKIH